MIALATVLVALPAAMTTPQSAQSPSSDLPQPAERARELRLKLPFAEGAEYPCCQGIGGETSHHHGFENEFSWDFEMPVGTPVHAAAHGRVVLVIDEHSEGGFSEAMKSKANTIWIDHGGGASSSYVHLAQDSSLVQVGQLVRAGQPIAKSGNTGYSVGPHLHFAVVNCLGRSLEASFSDVGVPVEGGSYKSKNDGVDCTWWAADSRIPSGIFAGAGIQLSVAPSAHLWDPSATFSFAGQCPGEDEVVFFASAWGGGETLFSKQIPVEKDGSFKFKLEPSELVDLHALRRFRVSMAPVDAEGNFSSSDMIGVHWVASAPAGVRPVHLPLFGGEPCEVFANTIISVGKGQAKRDLHSVTVQLSDGQEARACAGGRVLQTLVTSKAGIRESVSPRSACVHVDHGGGLEVFYAGLDPGSLKWAAGDVVARGSVLGTVGVKAVTSSRKLLLAVEGAESKPLRFIEGAAAVEASVRLTSKNDPSSDSASDLANGLVFGSDSRLRPAAFALNGVTLAPGNSTPASTYHVGTRYLIQGTAAEPSGTVEFVVRRGTSTRSKVVAKTVALESGEFELEVVLPDSFKTEPYRYALTSSAGKSKGAGAPTVWRPLLPIR